MGYYIATDIPVHHELADAFTLCDGYHCSVLGPTDPNRLYWISATIDPDGHHGGPLVDTPTRLPQNVYSWRTYPENLSEAGVSWKIYNNRDIGPLSLVLLTACSAASRRPRTRPRNCTGAASPRSTRTTSPPTWPPTGCPRCPG